MLKQVLKKETNIQEFRARVHADGHSGISENSITQFPIQLIFFPRKLPWSQTKERSHVGKITRISSYICEFMAAKNALNTLITGILIDRLRYWQYTDDIMMMR